MILAGAFNTGSPEGWCLSNAAGSTQSALTYDPTGGVGSGPAVYGPVSLTGNTIRRFLPAIGEMNVSATVRVRASSVAAGNIIASLRNGSTVIAQAFTTGSPTGYQEITVTGSFTAAHTAPSLVLSVLGSAANVYVSDWSVTLTPASATTSLTGGFNWGDTLDWVLNNAAGTWASRLAASAPPAVSASGGRSGYAASTSASSSGVGIVSVMRRVTVVDGLANEFRIWANAQAEGIGNFRLRLYSTGGSVLAETPIPAVAGYQQASLHYTPPVTTDAYVSFEHGVNALTGEGSVLWDDWLTAAQPLTKTYVRVDGVWQPATRFVRVDGVWQPATMYVRVDGVWQPV